MGLYSKSSDPLSFIFLLKIYKSEFKIIFCQNIELHHNPYQFQHHN